MPLNLPTVQSIINIIKVLIDFFVVWVLIYYTLRVVRNNSRTVQIFKGVFLIVLVRFIAYYLGLKVVLALADFVIQYGVLVVVIIFQQEIRALLERLGKSTVFSSLHSLSGNERERLINELVNATVDLSERRIGALMTLEQGHSLTDYIKTGTPINSAVTADLLVSIFVTTTPLHDGAVIIQGDRIACASAYFPPTALDLPTRYGARHRAAIGLSEITDSVTIVVSEETGTISIAEAGKLTEMDEKSLREFLGLLLQNSEKEVSNRIDFRVSKKRDFAKFNVDPIQIEKVEEDKDRDTLAEKMKHHQKRSFFKKDRSNEDSETDEAEAKPKAKLFKKLKDSTPEESEPTDLESLKTATSRQDSKKDEKEDEVITSENNGGDDNGEI